LKKRRFEVAGESFELDAAAPETGSISIGVDVKRIEAGEPLPACPACPGPCDSDR
jgi:hypothetical protein